MKYSKDQLTENEIKEMIKQILLENPELLDEAWYNPVDWAKGAYKLGKHGYQRGRKHVGDVYRATKHLYTKGEGDVFGDPIGHKSSGVLRGGEMAQIPAHIAHKVLKQQVEQLQSKLKSLTVTFEQETGREITV